MTYRIECDNGIVRTEMSGAVTAAEFDEYLRASRLDPAFRPDMHRLVVALAMETFPSSAEVRKLAVTIRSTTEASSVRFAVVVNTPLGIGMSNMILRQAGMGDRFDTFTDEESARAWLAGQRD